MVRKNLWDVAFKMRSMGVGSVVTRRTYDKYPGTFWKITRVEPNTKAGDRGKAWGVFSFKGQPETKDEEPYERRIRSPLKKEWRLVFDAEAGAPTAHADPHAPFVEDLASAPPQQ